MNRAERRRIAKSKEKKAVYTYTEEQLKVLVDSLVKMKVEQEKDAIAQEISAQILALLFVLPMEVLMDFYWTKSYAKKIPEFTQRLLDYYAKWENGELDMDKMKEDLWEYGGVRLEITETQNI